MRSFSQPCSDHRFSGSEESDLIEGAKKGDSEAFEELARRYRPRILKHLRTLCRSNEDMEDIVQNVLLTVYLKINTFRGASRFSTWLHRITLNAFLMHERSCKRKRLLFVPDEILDVYTETANGLETDPLPSVKLQGQELMENLARSVSELPGSFREVILLRDTQGMSIREVCRCLGLSVSAVKSRHHRARQMLRTRIERDFLN